MGWRAGRARLVQWLLGALTTYIPSPTVQSHSPACKFLIEVTVVSDSSASKDAVYISVIYLNRQIAELSIIKIGRYEWIGLV